MLDLVTGETRCQIVADVFAVVLAAGINVDAVAVGQIAAITAEGDSKRFTFQIPASVAPYVAPKGSICLNGASLTVNEVSDDDLGHWFTVNIIPHTAEWTTFGTAKAGDEVNIEIDVLARYLFRMNQLKS